MKAFGPSLIRLLCVIFGLAICCSEPSHAETLTRSLSYFTIDGVTPQEIEEQLTKLGPTVGGGTSRHPGATRMQFGNRITYADDPTKCRVAAAVITINAKVILPRWRRTKSADAAARLFWDVLSSDIVRHEEGHLVIARNHARELERELRQLRPAADCDALAIKAKAIQDQVMARHDIEQKRFDRVEAASLDRRLVRMISRRLDALTKPK